LRTNKEGLVLAAIKLGGAAGPDSPANNVRGAHKHAANKIKRTIWMQDARSTDALAEPVVRNSISTPASFRLYSAR